VDPVTAEYWAREMLKWAAPLTVAQPENREE
jgi:hypothetical protein